MTGLVSLVGQALKGVRPGMKKMASTHLAFLPEILTLTSPAFADGAPIPERFTADGAGVSPPLAWSGLPDQTEYLMLLVEDVDAPVPLPLVHLVMRGLNAGPLAEGEITPDDERVGRNAFNRLGWLPPSPVPGHGPHRYVFQLFALSQPPSFAKPPDRATLIAAVEERGVGRGQLVGTYERA